MQNIQEFVSFSLHQQNETPKSMEDFKKLNRKWMNHCALSIYNISGLDGYLRALRSRFRAFYDAYEPLVLATAWGCLNSDSDYTTIIFMLQRFL